MTEAFRASKYLQSSRVVLISRKKRGRVMKFYGRSETWEGEVRRLPNFTPCFVPEPPQNPTGRLVIGSCGTPTTYFSELSEFLLQVHSAMCEALSML